MAEEEQQNIPEDNNLQMPSDSDLFAGEVYEELSEDEMFAPNKTIHKYLKELPKAAISFRNKRFSIIQLVLGVSIVLVWSILLFTLFKSPSAQIQHTQSQTPPQPSDGQVLSERALQAEKADQTGTTTEALSLKMAEALFDEGEYQQSYDAYNQLRQSLHATAETELLRHFLYLKMGLCMKNAGDSEQAVRIFRTIIRSRSPIVRALANYHLSLLELQNKQYLDVRVHAYQTMALIEAIDIDHALAASLKRDCHFLIAESMTRNVLLLCDSDKDLPADFWDNSAAVSDPFTSLSEQQLQSLLTSGFEELSAATLGPRIRKLRRLRKMPPSVDSITLWLVTCHGAPIEELLARFAANADLDITWALGPAKNLQQAKEPFNKIPVSIYLPATTTQNFLSTAAGSVGLLACMEQDEVVKVFDPANSASLSEQTSLLAGEAVSLWQSFLLNFPGDQRTPNAHFALALLQAQRNNTTEAFAQYKLVANRFSKTPLAPLALLYSSRLKINIHDYFGAREDLKQLVEQYPDNELYDRACLYLADATMNAGLYDQAARLYRKVFNLGLALESQSASALGAAKCYYNQKNDQQAAKWLMRYINTARKQKNRDLYSAYFLLGKANLALGKPEEACDAFTLALTGKLDRQQYAQTIAALVEAQIQRQNFIEALAVLENADSWQFSQKESIEMLLLKSKTLRAIGLVEKAIMIIGNTADYTHDHQLKARVYVELGNNFLSINNLENARTNLVKAVSMLEAGPFAQETALKLADVCLKLRQYSQTISICSQLLDTDPPPQIRQKASTIMASAYDQQKNYDKAALALLAQLDFIDTSAASDTNMQPQPPTQ